MEKSGISVGTVVQVVFIILKLLNIISWSWLWVLAPLWMGACLTVFLLLIYFIVCFVRK